MSFDSYSLGFRLPNSAARWKFRNACGPECSFDEIIQRLAGTLAPRLSSLFLIHIDAIESRGLNWRVWVLFKKTAPLCHQPCGDSRPPPGGAPRFSFQA